MHYHRHQTTFYTEFEKYRKVKLNKCILEQNYTKNDFIIKSAEIILYLIDNT